MLFGVSSSRLVIEDIDAEPQLREVKDHLDDVVLKKLSLEYLSGRDTSAFLPKSLTKTQFKVFHQVRTYCGGLISQAFLHHL